jgi:hypothetical protein
LSEFSDRAASDPDLKGVTIATDTTTPRNIVLNIGEERDEVSDMVVGYGDKESRSSRVLIPGEFVEEEHNESSYSSISNVIDITDITDDVAEPSRKSHFSSVVKSVKMKTKVEKLKESSDPKTESEDVSVSMGVEDWKYNEVKQKSGSRPETPTWDYYDLSMQTVEIPLDDNESPKQGYAPVCLPMETTLGLMQSKVKNINKPKAVKADIKSKNQNNIPVIVVTDSDSGVSRSPDKSFKVRMPREEATSTKARSSHKKKRSSKEGASVKGGMSVNLESFGKPAKTKDGKFHVTADIHVPSAKTSGHETAIDMGDNDSVIIELENLESELKNIDLSEKTHDSSTSHVVLMPSDDLSSNLTAMKPIPQQVFIEDSLYESGDDSSEMSEFTLPFVPLTSKNDHLISEV